MIYKELEKLVITLELDISAADNAYKSYAGIYPATAQHHKGRREAFEQVLRRIKPLLPLAGKSTESYNTPVARAAAVGAMQAKSPLVAELFDSIQKWEQAVASLAALTGDTELARLFVTDKGYLKAQGYIRRIAQGETIDLKAVLAGDEK